ncbi:MAG: ATP-binding protein [Candidatus Thorarchaeota archaeon]
MCDYCVHHGAGKKWYLNARNLSKELGFSDFVREFSESYFSRDLQRGPDRFSNRGSRIAQPFTQEERDEADLRYRKFLHHQVITTEETIQVIELSNQQTEGHERAIVRFPCICRHRAYGGDPKLRCLGIAFTDRYTRRFPKYLGGGHEYVTPPEAIEFIENLSQNEPIVHAVSALGVPYVGMICNCDMDVCRPYLSRLRLGITSPFYKGHYLAQIETSRCSGCGECEDSCPFEAVHILEKDSLASVTADECYGCGVCERNCPEKTITLVLRKEDFLF